MDSASAHPPYRAALFDVFGTVVDWRTGIADQARPWFARHGRPGVDGGAFADRWRARYQPSMEPVRSGERAFTRLDVLHRESLVDILAEDAITATEAEIDELNLAWHRLPPWPDSVAGIARIRQSMVVAPLSNGNVSLLLDMARAAGLAWDTILGAEVARAYKPSPQSYLRTAEILGLEPAQCLMVACHNSDLAAARECGLATAFVSRPLEYGPGGGVPGDPAEPTSDWDVVASDINDLADLLAG